MTASYARGLIYRSCLGPLKKLCPCPGCAMKKRSFLEPPTARVRGGPEEDLFWWAHLFLIHKNN